MSNRQFALTLCMAVLVLMVLESVPAQAQGADLKNVPDFSGVAKCCGIHFEQEDGVGVAKCCGCTLAEWNVADAALVAAAMAGLVVISRIHR